MERSEQTPLTLDLDPPLLHRMVNSLTFKVRKGLGFTGEKSSISQLEEEV